jgi:nitrate reductase gamma subunit
MVYVAGVVFLAGTIWQAVRIGRGLRYSLDKAVGPVREPRLLGALSDTFFFPQLLKTHPVHWVVLIVFHFAVLLLLLGHLELIGEIGVLQVVPHRVFLGGGVIGVFLFGVALFFLFRRFHAPLTAISEPASYYTLIVFLLAILFGSQLHLARSLFAYSTIEVDDYRDYLVGMLTLRPTLPEIFTDDVVGHTFLLVLHVFFANLVLMLFPTTRAMHALLAFPLARLRRR